MPFPQSRSSQILTIEDEQPTVAAPVLNPPRTASFLQRLLAACACGSRQGKTSIVFAWCTVHSYACVADILQVEILPPTALEQAPLPPQTPILTEIVPDAKQQQPAQTIVKQKRAQHANATPAKVLSIREASARAMEKHLEQVPSGLFCCRRLRMTRLGRCFPHAQEVMWMCGI